MTAFCNKIITMAKLLICVSILLLTITVATATEKIVVLGLFSNKAMVEIHGKRYTLSVGEASKDGITLISSNSREAVLDVNGSVATYTLGTHISSSFTEPVAGTTVTIAPNSNGMYLVNGNINNFQVKFLVDTGATLVSMNKDVANRLGIDYKMIGEKSAVITASGQDQVYIVNLKSVSAGNIQLDNIKAAVHDSDFPDIVLLGNSFLNRVSINRDGQLLELSN